MGLSKPVQICPLSASVSKILMMAQMAAYESPRTTKLYDRTGDQITLDEVERIAI